MAILFEKAAQLLPEVGHLGFQRFDPCLQVAGSTRRPVHPRRGCRCDRRIAGQKMGEALEAEMADLRQKLRGLLE